MAIEMDSIATRFDRHHWMANEMDLVVVKWKTKRGKRQTPFCLFWLPQGWAI